MTLHARKGAHLEDPGAELLDRVTGFWDRYGRIALAAVGVIAAVTIIALLFVRSRAEAEEQASAKLAEANVMFWQGYYQQSMDRAKQVSQQWPDSPSGIEAHRLSGDDAYWSGDFKTAVTEYRRYLDKVKTGLLADAARRSLAYALESSGQYAEAMTTYDALVGKLDRESSAEFLYAAARCARASRQPAEAVKHLGRLVDEFGETTAANRARIALAELNATR